MKTLLLTLLLTLELMAGDLHFKSGFVQSHTQMIMDSKINSVNHALHVEATMLESITSIRGTFFVNVSNFLSDNKDRDEHMYEAIEAEKFSLATYTIKNIKKDTSNEDIYILNGTMGFHGIKKELSFKSQILNKLNSIEISAETQILGSDYGVKMPCMIFMCVDDEIDILVEITLSKVH